MTVTAQSHPALFRAFELISHDRGTQAGHTSYEVPVPYDDYVAWVNSQLRQLSPEELETFAIGEETEALALASAKGFRTSHTFLNAFFNEWGPDV